MTIKSLKAKGSIESESEVVDDEEWYTEIGTEEEKEIVEESDSYFFIN